MKWKYLTLDQLGSVSRGRSKHRPRNDESLFGGDYPFIQTGDVKKAGLHITDFVETYNEKGLAQSKLWDPGTLCITIAANIADTSILGIKACFPDSIIGFIANRHKCDVRFVKYSFDILQKKCQAMALGATQDNLSWEKMSKIKFLIPPLPTQRKIASILSTYDTLIEYNTKRIRLLEQMAENLYKEWFVRFRFPGHENAEMENGLPKGWKVEKLFEVADVLMGQSPESKYYNEEKQGLPFHQGVGSYGDFYLNDSIYSTEGKRIAKPFSIIFSVRAPVGRININLNRIILGRGVASINHKNGYNAFLLWCLKDKFAKEDSIGNGSIFTSVTKDELLKQKITIPTRELLEQFNSLTSNIEKGIRVLTRKNALLTRQRDLLLPRLMSGKLEVKP